MRLFLSTLFFAAAVAGQTASWSQVQVASAPPARYGASMVFDGARQNIVMCGGESATFPSSSWLSDTWVFASDQWTQSQQPFLYPNLGSFTAAAYDTARQKCVFWRPLQSTGGLLDWDGQTWTSLGGPFGLQAPALAYDQARGVTVMFGGLASGFWWQGGSLQNVTRTWDGVVLTQMSPAVSPPARVLHAMAYDAARQRVVLFGGCGAATSPPSFSDTWEWNGTNWLQIVSSNSPAARRGHAMVFDPSKNRVVLFGGSSAAPLSYFSDTWEWDGVNWVQVPVQSAPPGRWGHSMAYESSTGRVVIFGGTFDQGPLNDTWVLNEPAVQAQATSYGVGCGSPPLLLTPGAPPVLGSLASATIANAPTLLAGVAMGWSNIVSFPVTLPFELSGVGMPGCYLLQSLQLLGLSTAPVGPASLVFTLPIPYAPTLIGGHVYIQAYCYSPGSNQSEIVLSNGVDWGLGNF